MEIPVVLGCETQEKRCQDKADRLLFLRCEDEKFASRSTDALIHSDAASRALNDSDREYSDRSNVPSIQR